MGDQFSQSARTFLPSNGSSGAYRFFNVSLSSAGSSLAGTEPKAFRRSLSGCAKSPFDKKLQSLSRSFCPTIVERPSRRAGGTPSSSKKRFAAAELSSARTVPARLCKSTASGLQRRGSMPSASSRAAIESQQAVESLSSNCGRDSSVRRNSRTSRPPFRKKPAAHMLRATRGLECFRASRSEVPAQKRRL